MVDTKEELICPACGGKMTKIYMEGQSMNVDICLEGCGGILFDNRELEKCDEAHENATEILEAIQNKTFNLVDEAASRECPVCGAVMMKMGAASGQVQLDNCAFCGAKFLDNGELQRIRNNEEDDDALDQQIAGILDLTLQHIDELTYGMKPKKPSPRRQFVENMVRKFLSSG